MNKTAKRLFPKINKCISDYLYEEEGNIERSKILYIGSLVILASIFLSDEVFAGHSSHSSHKSHSSHSSSHYSGHVSHASHASHTSHSSATYDTSTDFSTHDPINETSPEPKLEVQTPQLPETPQDTPVNE